MLILWDLIGNTPHYKRKYKKRTRNSSPSEDTADDPEEELEEPVSSSIPEFETTLGKRPSRLRNTITKIKLEPELELFEYEDEKFSENVSFLFSLTNQN